MKLPTLKRIHPSLSCLILGLASATPGLLAQDMDVYELSPFTVVGEEDTGYMATSTLAGTRIRSDLKDVAASISVATKEFMNDVNATSAQDLLVYTLGTEISGPGGNFSGAGLDAAWANMDFLSGHPTDLPLRVRGRTHRRQGGPPLPDGKGPDRSVQT